MLKQKTNFMKTKHQIYTALLLLGANLFQPKLTSAQDGSLDLTFNTTGKVQSSIGTNDDDAKAIALQADGKIVVAGHSFIGGHYYFAVQRYNSDGSIDNSFDTDGSVVTLIEDNSKASAVAIQSDGKIIAAGFNTSGPIGSFTLVRYKSNGSLDSSFGSNGIVTTLVGTGSSGILSLGVQSDGKIVAAGYAMVGTYNDFAVARYNSNGSLDNTFSSDGITTIDFGAKSDIAYGMKIQTDNKIVVCGYAKMSAENDFAVARLLSDGNLDNSFDTDGKLTTKITGSFDEYASCVDIDADNKIIVGGYTNNSFFDYVVVRYNSDGSVDNSFDLDGIAVVDYGTGTDIGQAIGLKVQSDKKIILVGLTQSGADNNFAVIKFKINGTLDSTFDSDGMTTTAINNKDVANAVAIQTDGKILAAGGTYAGVQNKIALLRYNNTITSSSSIAGLAAHTNQYSIYPNPSTSTCFLKSFKPLNNAEIICYNILGQKVWSLSQVNGEQVQFNNSQLPKGQYTVKVIEQGLEITTLKMLIK